MADVIIIICFISYVFFFLLTVRQWVILLLHIMAQFARGWRKENWPFHTLTHTHTRHTQPNNEHVIFVSLLFFRYFSSLLAELPLSFSITHNFLCSIHRHFLFTFQSNSTTGNVKCSSKLNERKKKEIKQFARCPHSCHMNNTITVDRGSVQKIRRKK